MGLKAAQLKALVLKNLWVKKTMLSLSIWEFLYPVLFAAIIATLATSPGTLSLQAVPQQNLTRIPDFRCQAPNCTLAVLVDAGQLVESFLDSEYLDAALVNVQRFNSTSEMVLNNVSLALFVEEERLVVVTKDRHRHLVPLTDTLARFTRNEGQFGPSFVRAFPLPRLDVPLGSSTHLWQIYFVLVFLFVCGAGAVVVALERTHKLREHLELNGVSHSIYFLSHFIVQYGIGLVGVVLVLVVIFASGSVRSVSVGFFLIHFLLLLAGVVFVGLFCAQLADERSVMLIVVFFVGVSFGIIYLCTEVLIPLGSESATIVIILLSLLSPFVPFGLSMAAAAQAENTSRSVDWTAGYFPPLLSIFVLALSVILYTFLTWFLFRRAVHVNDEDARVSDTTHQDSIVEFVNASKNFNAENVIDNLTCSFPRGRVTALLGENGSGKTTLCNLILGVHNLSSGSLWVNDVRQIGVCPQHDPLWDVLTVQQHLSLFCGIKGISNPEQESARYAELVGLGNEFLETKAKDLSGGMKRRLTLALAIIGEPELVILDEPSSGLDPSAQQSIFRAIQSLENSSVILTTHSMLEAETIASNIIILRAGSLRAQGSVLDLCAQFDLGYSFSVAPNERVADLVNQFFPAATSEMTSTREITYKIPLQNVDQFPMFFEELGENVAHSLVAGSLREVFLKINSE